MCFEKFCHVLNSIKRIDTEQKLNFYDAQKVNSKADEKYYRSWEIWQEIIIENTGEPLGKPYYYYMTGARLKRATKGD